MECSEIIIGNTYRVVDNESVLKEYRGKMVEVVSWGAPWSSGKLLDIIVLDTGEEKLVLLRILKRFGLWTLTPPR